MSVHVITESSASDFVNDPHASAQKVWEASGKTIAPNGGGDSVT